MSDCLKPHEQQHARLPCPSPSPGVCPHSCPLNWWCHPTISSSVALFFCLQSFPASRSFPVSQFFSPMAKVLKLQLQHQSFHEYSGFIFFRIDWFNLLAVQGVLKSLLQHHSWKASVLWRSDFFMVQLSHPSPTSIHDYWKNHSFEYMGLCQQSDISAF